MMWKIEVNLRDRCFGTMRYTYSPRQELRKACLSLGSVGNDFVGAAPKLRDAGRSRNEYHENCVTQKEIVKNDGVDGAG